MKHFLEIIVPLKQYLDDSATSIYDLPPSLGPISRHVIAELRRFGYVPNAVRLLVRMDDDYYEPFLTVRQRAVADRMLAALLLTMSRRK